VKVDKSTPAATILTHPAAATNATAANFTFSGSDTGGSGVASFECKLDAASWGVCSTPQSYGPLGAGSHTFSVRAIDAADNTGAADAFTWSIDVTEPTAAPTQAPAANGAGWNRTDVTVSWNWSDSGSGIDVGNCTTSTVSVGEGNPVTLSATCKDLAGNPGSASYNVNVDKTNPDTSITGGPTNPSASTSASFTFGGSDVGGSGVASFECKIDTGAWGACTSPRSLASLAEGSHTFQVQAIDAAGNTDGSPASQTWVVDSVAPDTTITSGPTSPVTGVGTASVTFGFSGTDAAPSSGGPTFECKLDAGGWASCSSPLTVSGLANGSHTWQVRAVDGAGNVDSTPASQTFMVAICTFTGTAGNDTLTGTAGADVICGLGGNDTLAGLGGADILSGGPGTDTLNYSASAAGVTVDLTALTASGGDATGDTIIGGVDASENITGSNAQDTLTGDANANVLIANAGADTLSGLGGDDTLTGGTGGDTLLPGDGQSIGVINGGANAGSIGVIVPGGTGSCGNGCSPATGTDTVSYANISGGTGVTVNLATSTLGGATSGTISNVESVTGSPNADTLTLLASANAYGLAGNDTMTAGTGGSGFLDGGIGVNTLNRSGPSGKDVCFSSGGGTNPTNTCKFTVYP
jgi:Ca2+-binding RTX toxin-like protein